MPSFSWLQKLRSSSLGRLCVQVFSVDLRSLALFRVGLGLLIIADIIDRSRDLVADYTDFGVLPRGPLLTQFMNAWAVCVHVAVGTPAGAAALFAVQAAVALLLIVGYRSRLVAAISWFLLLSLHLRNPMVLQGGDDLLRMLLFWSMFLPLGARYSIDRALADAEWTRRHSQPQAGERHPVPEPQASEQVCCVGSWAVLVQVVLMYWGTALSKTGVEWHQEGSAVYYALNFDQLALQPALWLRQYYDVTRWLTWSTLAWEGIGPFFLLCPLFFGPVRTAACVMFMGMHQAFAMFLLLGLFPWIDMVSLVVLLPGWFWEQVRRLNMRRERQPQPPLALAVAIGRPDLQRGMFVLREMLFLQSMPIRLTASVPHVGWQLFVDGAATEGEAAREALLRASPLRRLLPSGCLRWLARRWSTWRTWRPVQSVGKRLARARVNYDDPMGVTVSTQAFALVCLVTVMWWNFSAWPGSLLRYPQELKPIAYMLRLDQNWGMFAPYPQKDDGWYVIEGHLINGEDIDVWDHRRGKPSYAKPALVSAAYTNQRWSKYMMNLWLKNYSDHRLYFGQYLCRLYNGANNVRQAASLSTFEITYVKEVTPPPGALATTSPVVIWKHHCF